MITQTVNVADTSTTLAATPTSPVHGQPVTFTATVASFAAGVPDRNGAVLDRRRSVRRPGCAERVGSGHGTAIASLTTGNHSITAAYAGDLNFGSSTSGALSLVVGPSFSATTVYESANPSVFGQGVTFSAQVAAAGDGAVSRPEPSSSTSTVCCRVRRSRWTRRVRRRARPSRTCRSESTRSTPLLG